VKKDMKGRVRCEVSTTRTARTLPAKAPVVGAFSTTGALARVMSLLSRRSRVTAVEAVFSCVTA
jgi:hypothetical protein